MRENDDVKKRNREIIVDCINHNWKSFRSHFLKDCGDIQTPTITIKEDYEISIEYSCVSKSQSKILIIKFEQFDQWMGNVKKDLYKKEYFDISECDDIQNQTDKIMELIKLQVSTYVRPESVIYLENVIKLLISTRKDRDFDFQSLRQISLLQEIRITEQENYIKILREYFDVSKPKMKQLIDQHHQDSKRIAELELTISNLRNKTFH